MNANLDEIREEMHERTEIADEGKKAKREKRKSSK